MDIWQATLALAPAFMAGLLAGGTVAFPLGPLGQLAARLTTEKQRRAAREVAVASVLVDALLAALILLFLNNLPQLAIPRQPLLLGGIGLVLVLLGAELWRSAPHAVPGQLPGGFKRPWQCAVAYLLLHPGSILTFLAAFGMLHLQGVFASSGPSVWLEKTACWAGVVLGMLAMWVVWLLAVHGLKRHCNNGLLRLIFARGLALGIGVGGAILVWHSGVITVLWPLVAPYINHTLRFTLA